MSDKFIMKISFLLWERFRQKKFVLTDTAVPQNYVYHDEHEKAVRSTDTS